MRPTNVLPLLVAAALSCQPAPPPDTSAEAKKAIDAANGTWASLTAGGHADSLASYYHQNAVLLPPNMAPVRGKEAIRGFFAQMNAMAVTLTIHAESVWASGASATELGRWNFVWAANAKRPPGFPAADSGKYIVRWVNAGGRWLMMQDIWNSDLPLPMAPAPSTSKKS
jgi:ketosteroid isomerase-like protein